MLKIQSQSKLIKYNAGIQQKCFRFTVVFIIFVFFHFSHWTKLLIQSTKCVIWKLTNNDQEYDDTIGSNHPHVLYFIIILKLNYCSVVKIDKEVNIILSTLLIRITNSEHPFSLDQINNFAICDASLFLKNIALSFNSVVSFKF